MRGWRNVRGALLIGLIFMLAAETTWGRVLHVEVVRRVLLLHGRPFGAAGPYELLEGWIEYGFDPANPANRRIVDLMLAPRGEDGLVHARGNFVVLQPARPETRRGIALVEVSNRGGKFSLRYFNHAGVRQLEPDNPESLGDGLLMEEGLTVIWVGWQFDVPRRAGALYLEVPTARHPDGSPIFGLVRADWTVLRPADVLLISHRGHVPYPVADPADPVNQLTVRDGREAPRRVIPRRQWRFARLENGTPVPDSVHIYLDGGFQPGKIYELVYRAQNPAVVGLGLAVIRDIISFAKYSPECPFPVRLGIAAGVSQTGRFLRHFLYQGFNVDEQGRKAYDGMMIMTAGAGRGSFNHRFAQPSRDAHRFSAFFYPTDLFPFTSRTQFDSLQWRSDGLLAHLESKYLPRIFYINTGYEYWGRAGALIHISVDGRRDVPPFANERIYHLASCQHFVGRFPPRQRKRQSGPPIFRGNPVDFSVNYRALLLHLIKWVEKDVPPPDSRYPRLAEGELVTPAGLRIPGIPGLKPPAVGHVAYRVDYGPRWEEGIVDWQPPRIGRPYPLLVPQVDLMGHEHGGIRNVEIRVPVASYFPWNLRWEMPGDTAELADFLGTTVMLPRTREEQKEWGDPRPSLEELYGNKARYLKKVSQEISILVGEGFVLERDRSRLLKRASDLWDWVWSQGSQ